MPDPATLSVEFAETERNIPDDLWAACFTPQQEGRWWCRLAENAGLEKQFRIFYAVVRRNGEPAGIVPMFTMELSLDFIVPDGMVPLLAGIGKMFPNLSQPKILFIGSPCADEGIMGFLPSVDRRAALLCVQEAIETEAPKRGAGLILWKDFPESYDADFAWLSERKGLFRMTSFPGTVIDFASANKADYFAGMKGSRRYNLRQKLRDSARHLDAEIEIIQRPERAVLDAIFKLFVQTRDKADTQFEQLDLKFFEQAALEPTAYFILVRERATLDIVAFMLCFDLGGVVINKYVGLDYSRPKEWYLLFRLADAAIDWTLARGGRALQSGQTGYFAKISQRHRLVPLTIHGKHLNPAFHWICKLVTRRVRWATLDDDLAVYVKAHPDAN